MAKKMIPQKCLPWIEARRRFHLFHAHTQMARELGLNLKKFSGLPLPEFIKELYFKHFRKIRPENVRSSQQVVHDSNRKKAERRARKQAAQLSRQSSEDPPPKQ